MKRNFTLKSLGTFLTALLLLSCFQASATFTPVTLTGFTADVVANGIGIPTATTSIQFDAASANPAYVLIAQDYQLTSTSTLPVYYLPNSGTITPASGPGYQLAPYTGNNSLRLTSTATTGTLTFGNNTLIGDVYVLAAAGSGSATATITINFVGGTTQQVTGVTFADWFNGSPFVVQGIGRANRATGLIDAGAGATNPRLYQAKVTLTIPNYTKQIASVTVQRTGGSATISTLNVMAITVDHQSCLPVQGLASSGVTTTSANLNWTAGTGSVGYEYALTNSATPPASGTAWSTNSYTASGLNPGTTYYMHVRNQCGPGSYSIWSTVQFTTLPCPTAGAPFVTNNTPGTVTFNWPGTTTPGVVDYQYAVTSSTAAPSSWSTTSFTNATISTLTPGATYYAQVRSNCGTTLASWQYVQFVNPFPPCYTPINPLVTDTNMHGAKITWSTAVNGIAYQYAVTTNPLPPASGTSTTDTTYTATNLTAGTTYYAHVRTHCGTTNFSSWVTTMFTTPANCLPPITPLISNVTANSAYVEWNNYPGIYGFEYFLDQNPAPPSFSGYNINYNALAPLNLTPGTQYYFHLRTRCDTFNFSPWVTETFTTESVCTAPGTPVVNSIGSNTATFNWSAVPGAVSYEYAITNSIAIPTSGTLITTLSLTDNTLTPNTQYYFHLRAFCSASDSSQWVMASFNTTPIVSVNSIVKDGMELNAFPNPVQDLLIVAINGRIPSDGRLMLTDVSGKLMSQSTAVKERTEIDMRNMAPGIYFLKYVDREGVSTLKILKQ